jgi:hypothetical protein
MTHPRAAKGRFVRRTEWRSSTSILIAAVDDLVMRMTVSDADDPAAAKRARWAQNSARRHRRRALGDCSDDHPDGLAILACVRLRGLAPAPLEQDGDGMYACARWRIGLTHDGGKRAHGLVCVSPAQ